MKKLLPLSILVVIALATACQSYTSHNEIMRNEFYAGNTKGAIKKIDDSGLSVNGNDYVLYRMEKGMLLYTDKQYASAIKLWIEADKKADDLYTTSLTKSAASLLINDSVTDYNGEAHERILLPTLSSVSFFAEGNIDNSLVMIRRSYVVRSGLIQNETAVDAFKYDAFSHYFAGMVYEAKSDYDNAIVEYRLALENIQSLNKDGKNEFKPAKEEVIKSLARLAQYKNREDINKLILHEIEKDTWEKQDKLLQEGEVYIIYESGKSPIKVPKDFILPGLPGTMAKISFPVYKTMQYKAKYADVYVNKDFVGKTILMADVGKMAELALSDRKVRDMAKMTARIIAKNLAAKKLGEQNPYAGLAANVFNVATEVADSRGWTTLPDTIQLIRVHVYAGKETEIQVKPEGMLAFKFSVNLSAGEKKLYRFRTFQ